MPPFEPRLLTARNARERMQALGEFMEFWLGPRKNTFGVPRAELAKHPLPVPLKWLYEFAGKWPALKDGENSRGKGRILGCQDWLRPISKLTTSKSGKLEFLDENQGCWVCRTLSSGDDPGVWCEGDLYDAKKQFVEGEIQICDSLSKFLVTYVLQELTLGSRCILDDEPLVRKFRNSKKDKVPLWQDDRTPDFRPSNFWLWNGCLAANLSWGGWQLAANHPQAIEFLGSKQGAIEILQLSFLQARGEAFDSWMVSFMKDGSASASYRETPPFAAIMTYPDPVKARVQTGAFDLAMKLNLFASRLKKTGRQQKDVEVNIYHTGQLGAPTQYLSDVTLFEELFGQVIAAAVGTGRLKLKRLFAERWRR